MTYRYGAAHAAAESDDDAVDHDRASGDPPKQKRPMSSDGWYLMWV